MRPPALCEGCGHRDMYTVLTEVLRAEYPSHKVFSDIGCYTLGANAPFNAIDSCVDMELPLQWQKRLGCRSPSCGCRYRRLHLHPLRHDRPAGLRKRKRQRHHRHLRQRNHSHDRRTRIQPEPAVSKLSVQVSA